MVPLALPTQGGLRGQSPTLAPAQAPLAAIQPQALGAAAVQAPPVGLAPAAKADNREAPAASATVPSSPSSSRTLTPELVSRLFSVPAGGLLAGRPFTLAEVLASAHGRGEQLDVTRAYWRLSLAVGEYRARQESVDQLRRIEPRAADAATLRAARTKLAETLRNAEIAVGRAQRALVETAQLSPNQPLPLPADLPHVGPYRTNFEEVYASQSVPSVARLTHRSLPLRRKEIDARAKAVRHSEYATGRGG